MSLNPTRQDPTPIEMHVTARAEHAISRRNISNGALRVLYRLNEAGYQAFLVGGAVRDLLLGGHPKDFDIATNATPEEVRSLFRNCRLIGRRFRLAHVVFGREIVEVATFRGTSDDGSGDRHLVDGRIVRDNVYGTIEEDALRRDFTVNALYYDIADFSVRDYVGGMARPRRALPAPDRRSGIALSRGSGAHAARGAARREARFHDRAGNRRAVRAAWRRCSRDAPPARLFDESLKLFLSGYGLASFHALQTHGLLEHVFRCIRALACIRARRSLSRAARAHAREHRRARARRQACHAGVPVRRAALGAGARRSRADDRAGGTDAAVAWAAASARIMGEQAQRVAIPRRFAGAIEEIWVLQPRFEQRIKKRVFRLLAHPRFRAAYDFLLLRSSESPALTELAEWWTAAQTTGSAGARQAASCRSRRSRPTAASSPSPPPSAAARAGAAARASRHPKAAHRPSEPRGRAPRLHRHRQQSRRSGAAGARARSMRSRACRSLRSGAHRGSTGTAPWGKADQPAFVNAAAAISTQLPPRALLDALLAIERERGRERDGTRWGPRTIDLDLLLYGDALHRRSRAARAASAPCASAPSCCCRSRSSIRSSKCPVRAASVRCSTASMRPAASRSLESAHTGAE